MATKTGSGKSLESWIWDAACSIRGARETDAALRKIPKQLGVAA